MAKKNGFCTSWCIFMWIHIKVASQELQRRVSWKEMQVWQSELRGGNILEVGERVVNGSENYICPEAFFWTCLSYVIFMICLFMKGVLLVVFWEKLAHSGQDRRWLAPLMGKERGNFVLILDLKFLYSIN